MKTLRREIFPSCNKRQEAKQQISNFQARTATKPISCSPIVTIFWLYWCLVRERCNDEYICKHCTLHKHKYLKFRKGLNIQIFRHNLDHNDWNKNITKDVRKADEKNIEQERQSIRSFPWCSARTTFDKAQYEDKVNCENAGHVVCQHLVDNSDKCSSYRDAAKFNIIPALFTHRDIDDAATV